MTVYAMRSPRFILLGTVLAALLFVAFVRREQAYNALVDYSDPNDWRLTGAVNDVLGYNDNTGDNIPSNDDSVPLYSPPVDEEVKEVKVIETPKSKPKQEALPGYCDYCGPSDTICQKYGPFNLARSRSYEGPNARLKRVLAKGRSGKKLKIGVLGGSVTKGHSVNRDQNWTTLYGKYFKDVLGIDVEVINGGVGATVSEYMETCFLEHIPEDVDIVVIELAINDQRLERLAKGYDNLIRGIFELKSKPAIINLQIMALSFATITMGGDLHSAVAQYYDTPIVSVRNMLLPYVLSLTQDEDATEDVVKHWFHIQGDGLVDTRHMNWRGHELMADLLSSFTARVACEGLREERARKALGEDKKSKFLAEMEAEERDWVAEGLVEWMPEKGSFIPDSSTGEYVPRISMFEKYEPHTSLLAPNPSCMTMSTTLHPLVPEPALSHGWEKWSHPKNPGKLFLRATEPGAKAVFKLRTAAVGRLRVTYLRSKDYGLGSVWCWADNTREKGVRLDGWWDVQNIHVSQTATIVEHLPPGEHTLTCELLKETKDPGKGTDFRMLAVDGA